MGVAVMVSESSQLTAFTPFKSVAPPAELATVTLWVFSVKLAVILRSEVILATDNGLAFPVASPLQPVKV